MVWHVALCARLCESLHRREVWTALALGDDRQSRHVMAVSGYSGINAAITGFHEHKNLCQGRIWESWRWPVIRSPRVDLHYRT